MLSRLHARPGLSCYPCLECPDPLCHLVDAYSFLRTRLKHQLLQKASSSLIPQPSLGTGMGQGTGAMLDLAQWSHSLLAGPK